MTAYVLTTAAEADLRDIIRYSRKQWGVAQTQQYFSLLEIGFARLAKGEGVFKDLDEIYSGLRMAHCEHHYLFCLPRPNASALIVAILHERMDLMTRLAHRLQFE